MESMNKEIKRFIKDLKDSRKFEHVFVKNERLIVVKNGIAQSNDIKLIKIAIKQIGYSNFYDLYIKNIGERFNMKYFNISMDRIFPAFLTFKKMQTCDVINKMIKHDTVLGLKVTYLYYQKLDGFPTVLLKSDNVDQKTIFEKSYRNLENYHFKLGKVEKNSEIFYVNSNIGINSACILSEKLKELIVKEIGEEYIFILPTIGEIYIARNNDKGLQEIREKLKEYDTKDAYFLTSEIYRVKNDNYTIVK